MRKDLHQKAGKRAWGGRFTASRTVSGVLYLMAMSVIVNARAKSGFPPCTAPTITSTTGATVCGFGTITMNAVASAGTVNWYNSGGTYLGSGSTYSTFISSTETFYVDATDGSCTTPTQTAITATANAKPTVTATASTSGACEGNTVTLGGSATGGASPYSYSWSGAGGFSTTASSSTAASFTAEYGGFYTLSATDGNGCTGSNSALVSVYSNPVLSPASTPNPVCTGNTLYLTAGYNSGGSGVATYAWTGPNGYTATGESPTLENATTYAAGVYSVVATDSRGCIGAGTTYYTSVVANSVPLVVSGGTSICPGTSASLSGSGGSYYEWAPTTSLSSTGGSTVTATPSSTTTYTVTGHVGYCYNKDTVTVIVLQTYSVTASVTSSNGTISDVGTTNVCSGTNKTFTVTPNSGYYIVDVKVDGTSIGNTPPFTISNVTAPHSIAAEFALSCTTPSITAVSGAAICGAGTASLGATASAGTLNWYSSSTGGTSLGSGSTYSPSVSATTTYYVEATDGSCVSSRTAVTATVNPVPSASASVTNVLCYGQSTGSVSVSGSGGTGTYTVSGSATTALSAGSYSYTVTDSKGCTATVSATVSQPSSAVSASASVTNPLCNGGTGTITVGASGGTGSYSGTGAFSGLAVGSHSYTVTDGNGCSATASATVSQPASVVASSSITDVSCNGGSNGAVVVSATGGTGSYTGTGTFSGLSAGTFSYTVTDANGCTAATTGSVGQPSALSVTATATNVSCNSADGGNHSNGSISTSVTGGTGSYSYAWTGGGNGSGLTGITAGVYSVTVTDGNGCTKVASATVGAPSAINVGTSVTNISCNNSTSGNHSNGSITASVSGGTGSYSYAWSNSSTSANPSGLTTGTYTVTVTDANSCTRSASATVGQPSALTVSLTPANVSCGGTSNGSVTASVSGGTSSYSYAWSNSATGATNTGLTAATYSVTVTDANSCTVSGSATVGTSTSTTTTISGSTSVLGNVAYTYSGPSGMSTYSWTISGGDHVCDSKCHHASGHSCGSGCDHYSRSCSSSCHHHSSHSCTNSHIGDHHCNKYCHHHSSHSCNSDCDHNGHSCSSNCHHHSSHRCGHDHCGSTLISGSSTGSSVSVVSPCCATSYLLTLTATNSTGCTSTATITVNVTPSATITVYSSLYTVGSGWHPSTTKSTLAANLKVFTRSTSRRRSGNQSDYATMWNSTSGQVTNVSISSPASVNIGGGPAYRYVITVPAGGHYIVVGQSTVSSTKCGGTTCTIYTGKKLGGNDDCDGDEHGRDDDDDDELDACTDTKVRFHSIIKDQTGRCREADTHEEHGSLMLVVSPMELAFDDSVSYLPVVYESVEGNWDVSVSAEPPYGFYTEPSGELSASVTDSLIDAVQFDVVDTGSEWTFTTLTHSIAHKGENRVAHSKPVMVNERTNKPVEINVSPNPATSLVKVTMPKFEGRATLYVYNLLGQVVTQKPIEVISGMSVSMDVSMLTPGIYMLSAENTQGKASSRLIISEK